MTSLHWYATLLYGLAISTSVLGITAYAHFILELPPHIINNMAFYTLILAQLFNIFNIPTASVSFFRNEVTKNYWVWFALAICIFLTYLASVYNPVANALSMVPLSFSQYQIIVVFAFGSLVLAQILKRILFDIKKVDL